VKHAPSAVCRAIAAACEEVVGGRVVPAVRLVSTELPVLRFYPTNLVQYLVQHRNRAAYQCWLQSGYIATVDQCVLVSLASCCTSQGAPLLVGLLPTGAHKRLALRTAVQNERAMAKIR
jgi:hypothetical protein